MARRFAAKMEVLFVQHFAFGQPARAPAALTIHFRRKVPHFLPTFPISAREGHGGDWEEGPRPGLGERW